MEKIVRPEYLDLLVQSRDMRLIKIITGVRRCGKSTLLQLYQDVLLSSGVAEQNIVAINFEDMDNRSLLDPDALHAHVLDRLQDVEGMLYVFLDEIQSVSEFPRVIDSLHLRERIDLYVTGSNSFLLSSELATLISGRYIEVKMLPFSFREFRQTRSEEEPAIEAFRNYLEIGSFPYASEIGDKPDILRNYLQSLYDSVLVNDIMERKSIRDPLILRAVTDFVFDNIGNELSSSRIANALTASGRKVDVRTVERYLAALCECFLVYEGRRYNIKGKQVLKSGSKYYAVDMGLRRMIAGGGSMDHGRMLENIVYLELLRRGGKIFVGKMDAYEVDFAVKRPEGICYYQVAASVLDETTLERELRSLRAIKDQHPKILLTLDQLPEANYDGIVRRNVLDWLCDHS